MVCNSRRESSVFANSSKFGNLLAFPTALGSQVLDGLQVRRDQAVPERKPKRSRQGSTDLIERHLPSELQHVARKCRTVDPRDIADHKRTLREKRDRIP